MKKVIFAAAALLSAAGIAAGAWGMLVPLFPRADTEENAAYYLKDTGGRVAVYAAVDSETPLAVYDIYVNLLPESDALRLKKGIRVYGDAALEMLLEDLGA